MDYRAGREEEGWSARKGRKETIELIFPNVLSSGLVKVGPYYTLALQDYATPHRTMLRSKEREGELTFVESQRAAREEVAKSSVRREEDLVRDEVLRDDKGCLSTVKGIRQGGTGRRRGEEGGEAAWPLGASRTAIPPACFHLQLLSFLFVEKRTFATPKYR